MSGPSSIQLTADATRHIRTARLGGGDASGLRSAARQLEGVFVGMMFEEMARGLNAEDGLLPKSPGREMYQQWFRSEVAAQFSRSGGLGLGDVIARELGHRPQAIERPSAMAQAPRELPPVGLRPSPMRGHVTSPFGERRHPVTGEVHFHSGVDIAAPVGTPIHTPFGGRVVEIGESPNLGKYVVVEHRGGFRTTYGHLSQVTAKKGRWVPAGRVIAASGRTGRVTGPHLHFAMARNGKAVDPGRWIKLHQN